MVAPGDLQETALTVPGEFRVRLLKRSAWLIFAALFVLLAALLVIPAFVDLGVFKATYLPILQETLHRRVDVGEVRLTLLPTPFIRLSDLKISDSPVFPDNTFFATQELRLSLKLWPLLRGRFEVTELILEQPVINLLKRPDGSFNYSDIARSTGPLGKKADARKSRTATKSQETAPMPLLIPARMRIHDGRLNLQTEGQSPVHIDGIELSLPEFSESRPFPYHAAFHYPGLKTISLEGELSYQEDQARLQLKDSHIKVQDVTFPLEGAVSNLTTVPRVNLSLTRDDVEAQRVVEILSTFGLAPRETSISGPMSLHMTVAGPSNNLVTQVRGLFKNVKVHGKRAVKGNLNGEVLLKLPLGSGGVARRLLGNGSLIATDGELTNVDLIKKVQRVTGMMGLSRQQSREATTFKSLETDFVVADGAADFKRIYLVNPQMEVHGTGKMNLQRANLDIELDTVLSAETSARSPSKSLSFFKDEQGRVVVPLKVTGPVESPAVNLDGEKLAERGMNSSKRNSFGALFKQFFRR
jgi:AsmA family/AsmA-like C-terminal region